MINNFAKAIVARLAIRGFITSEQIDVVVYGCEALLYTILSTIGLLLIGGLWGRWIETVLVILVFYSNQSLGGGFHASSHTKCFLVMCAGMMIALLILCCELSDFFFMAMALLSYILLYVKPLILHPHKAYLAYNSTMYTQRSRIAVSLELLFFIFFSVTGLTSLNEALSAGMALSAVSRIFAFALRHGKAQ